MSDPHSILSRVAHGLKERDWGVIGIEFAIVFAGVLLGTQVSNWNDDRKDRAAVNALLERLKPDLHENLDEAPALAAYFHSRVALAEKAEKLIGEHGNDLDLVTSARLAGSYARVVDFDRDTYAMKIGADTVSHIPNEKLRNAFADLIALQNDPYVRFQYIDTDFRRLILRLYPSDISVKIAEACNYANDPDVTVAELQRASRTKECVVDLPAAEVARLAATLRGNPEVLELLREHINRLRTTTGRIDRLEAANRAVLAAMGEKDLPASK